MTDLAPQPKPLSPKQQAFVAAYIGVAKHNATEAARIAGYTHPNKQGPALLVNLGIKAAIAEHLAEIKAQGIALKQNRIDAANDRHQRMQQVIAERADDPSVAQIPGGTSGLIVKQLKRVHHRYEPNPDDDGGEPIAVTEEVWEAAVDTALLKSMLDHEKQVAQERGEWVEKAEVAGAGGGPVRFVYEEYVAPSPTPVGTRHPSARTDEP